MLVYSQQPRHKKHKILGLHYILVLKMVGNVWTMNIPLVSVLRHWRHELPEISSQFWQVLISFSDVSCALQKCDSDEMNWGLSSFCFSCKMGPICAFFLHKNFSLRLEISQRAIGFGIRFFFSSIVFCRLLLYQNKKNMLFRWRFFHRLQSCAWHRYIVKLDTVKLHTVHHGAL